MHTRFIRSGARWHLAIAGLLSIAPCHGQSLADPTRPAPAWLAAQIRVPGAAAQAVTEAEPSAPGVHIIVSGPTRQFAMVDGEPVRQGENHNGSRLVAINKDGLVWQKDGTQQKSRMSPNVEKTAPGKPNPNPARVKVVVRKSATGESQ